MRFRVLVLVAMTVLVSLVGVNAVSAYTGVVTSAGCGLDTCHTHPGFTDFVSWHESHQSPEMVYYCEVCHPNNHTSGGPPSAPDATYSLAEACNPCHYGMEIAPAHESSGVGDCIVCHPAAGSLTGVVTDSGGPLLGVTVTIDGSRTVLTYAGGQYFASKVPVGLHEVVFSLPGYQSQTVTGVDVAYQSTTVLNISLVPTLVFDTHTLSYTAGAGGSIEGSATQVLDFGADGSAVTAVPNAGYRFVKWSDGSTANPRTDTGVVADLAVTAEFASVAPVVTGAKFSNPIAYQLKSLLTTRFSCNVDVGGAIGRLEILNGSGAVVKIIYYGAMAAGANTLPAWNGLDASGARLFTAAWTWRLTVTKNGQTTVVTGKIPVSKIYFNMTGTATSLSSQVKYMMPGNANIYVHASTTRATDTLSISCYEPSGRRVGTLSYALTSAKALNATAYFKLATVVRERGNHTWRISGSNVTYSILVIQ